MTVIAPLSEKRSRVPAAKYSTRSAPLVQLPWIRSRLACQEVWVFWTGSENALNIGSGTRSLRASVDNWQGCGRSGFAGCFDSPIYILSPAATGSLLLPGCLACYICQGYPSLFLKVEEMAVAFLWSCTEWIYINLGQENITYVLLCGYVYLSPRFCSKRHLGKNYDLNLLLHVNLY